MFRRFFYHLIIITLALFFWSFTGQNKDSVAIRGKKAAYIEKINILTDLAEKVYTNNPERCLWYAQTALDLAKKNNDKELEAKILVLLGNIYKRASYNRLAIPYYYKALQIASEQKDYTQIANNNVLLGDAYYALEYPDTAALYYNKGLELYEKLNNKPGIASTNIRLGNTFWFPAGYDKALELYLKALAINEETKNKQGIAEVNTNIGSLYTMLGDNKNALKYFRIAFQNMERFDKTEQISNLYYRYGVAFENLNQFDSAFYYYQSAKIILDSLKNSQQSGLIEEAMGSIFFKQGKTELAIKHAKNALYKFEQNNYRFGIASVYNDLANYLLHIEDYTNSLIYLEKGLKLSKELHSIELLKSYYLSLSKYYKLNESYKKALHYHELYQQMNDSVLNKEKNTRIAELQTKYETNKNIKELLAKTEENKKNLERIKRQRRNLYVFGIGIILILGMSAGLLWQYRLLKNREASIKEINKELDSRVKERTAALQLTQFSIDHAADPIFWLDKTGNFIYINNAACKYMEYKKEDFLQTNISSIIPKFTHTEWLDIWEIIINEGSLVIELYFKKKDQSISPVEITFNYISHEGKEYAFAFIRDISDRKLKEENLRKAKEKAEEADKLKSAFLANMSHEIRTPMNAILGFSDLLINEELTQQDKNEFASIIKNSADTLLKLIDDIIDISIIEAGQLKMNNKHFQLNNTLKEINRFYQEEKIRLQKTKLEIRLNESTFNDQISLYTDPVRFRQIVTNLVGNAIKFTEEGYIEIGYIKGADKVKIYVKDTGIGIPQDKIPFIFKRFRKHTDNNKFYSGTGLGLAISKKLVEQMGGTISVASEVGKGSIFWFTIPFEFQTDNESITPVGEKRKKNKNYNWENKTLLIVEDVQSNYLFLEKSLKKTHIKIHWAKDGYEALDLCKTIRPHIILMDIQLPRIDGYEVTRKILDIYPEIPIIAQTAFAFSNEKEKILNGDFKDYISKPIDTKILFDTLQKYLE